MWNYNITVISHRVSDDKPAYSGQCLQGHHCIAIHTTKTERQPVFGQSNLYGELNIRVPDIPQCSEGESKLLRF